MAAISEVIQMIFKGVISLVLMSFVACSAPASTTRIVRNDAELESALKVYNDLTVLLVAPGRYNRLTIIDVNPVRQITIKAQDELNPPQFSAMLISKSSKIFLKKITIFRNRSPSEQPYTKIAQIMGSSDINVDGAYIHGSLDGNPSNDMQGLYIRESKSISITNSKFEENTVAVFVDRSDAVNISNSEFVHLGRDAIDLAGSGNITISDNIMHAFILTPGEHPDGIQAWTANQDTGVHDVKIINNLIHGDPSGRIQGVFLADERRLAKLGRGHRNIQIDRNIVAYPLWNGIFLDSPQNVRLSQNRVLNGPGGPPVPGGPVFPWISVGVDTVLDRNEAPRYVLGGKVVDPPRTNKAWGKRDMSDEIKRAADQWRAEHGNLGGSVSP